MRKVDDGEKRKEKIMTFKVATNVVASQPPERRPTGTPSARANNINGFNKLEIKLIYCAFMECEEKYKVKQNVD